MTGKHDKSVDDEQSSNLLLTGPIAIRGLGRGVKDALVRGRPSRHRAFAGEPEHDVALTPLQRMLASGPTVPEVGPSSDLTEHAATQRATAGGPPFPEVLEVSQAGADGPQEDRMDDRVEHDAPVRDDRQEPETGDPTSTAEAVDDAVASPVEGDTAAEVPDGDVVEVDVEAEQQAHRPEDATVDEFDALPPKEPGDLGDKPAPSLPVDEADGAPRLGVEATFDAPEAERGDVLAADPAAVNGGDVEALPGPEDRLGVLEAEQLNPTDAALSPEDSSADRTDESVAHAAGKPSELPEVDDADDAHAESAAVVVGTEEQEAESEPSTEGDAASVESDDEPTEPGDVDSAQETEATPEDPAERRALVEDDAVPASGAGGGAEHPLGEEPSREPGQQSNDEPDHPDDSQVVIDGDSSAGDDETDALPTVAEGPGSERLPDDTPLGETAEQEHRAAEDDPTVRPDEDERADEARGPASDDLAEAHEPGDETGARPSDADAIDIDPEQSDGSARPWTTSEELFRLPPQKTEHGRDAAEVGPAGEDRAEAVEQPDDQGFEPDPAAESLAAVHTDPQPAPTESDTAAPGERQQAVLAAAAVPAAVAVAPASVAAAAPGPTGPRPPRATSSTASRPSGRLGQRPLRERFGREATGIALLVVLALVCAGLITAVVFKTRNDSAVAAKEAANYTFPPLATPEPARTGPVVAVIGDGSTSTAASGVSAEQRWTALLGSSLGGTVDAEASSDMGYAAKSGSGDTFVQAVRSVPSNAQVVVFFGGAADADVAPLSLAKAATNAYAAAIEQAPDAKILVVGPAVTSGVDSADLTTIRNTLRGAAAVVKATWVDPIDKGWLPEGRRSASPSDLSARDEKAIASKMRDAVQKALG